MLTILTTVSVIIIITTCISVYQKATNAVCKSQKRLQGRVTIVTGGTAGMGFEIAKDFATRGAKVIIASPFKHEGLCAEKKIKEDTKNDSVVFKKIDLGSLDSVRQFAADILKTEDRVDILVNNAGIGLTGDFPTRDGLNYIMHVNYYGHFLLTILLLPLLRKTGTPEERSRVVNVSSLFHWLAGTDISKMNSTGYYWFLLRVYGNSKLCLLLFTNELSKRLEVGNVVVNCVDPGAVGTRIFDSINVVVGSILTFLAANVFKTPWQGAQNTIHAALDDEAGLVSGQYFKNCKVIRARPDAYDNKKSKFLWEESIRLVKLNVPDVEQCVNGFSDVNYQF